MNRLCNLYYFVVDIVTVHQSGPPRITFSKRQFTIGENLVANCTTSKAHPAPHITWLINGKQVRIFIFLRIFHACCMTETEIRSLLVMKCLFLKTSDFLIKYGINTNKLNVMFIISFQFPLG